MKIGTSDFEIENDTCQKLSGIHFEKRLTRLIIYTRLMQALAKNVLARISECINLSKRKTLINVFFDSQFKYCPLIRICHICTNNMKTDYLLRRCLGIIYNDNSHHLGS